MRPSFIIHNERIIESRIIADEFNKYFVSLAPNINKSLSPDKNDDILNFKLPYLVQIPVVFSCMTVVQRK